jgi:hypothetical protein
MTAGNLELPYKFIKVTLKFCELFIHKNMVISEINEGVIVGKNRVMEIIDAISTRCNDLKKVDYISNRINSYSVKPMEYAELSMENPFFGSFSVIIYNKLGETNLTFERMFLKREINRYDTLQEALFHIEATEKISSNQ